MCADFRIHIVFGTTSNPEAVYRTGDVVDRFLQVPLHFTGETGISEKCRDAETSPLQRVGTAFYCGT